jgi:sulfoxide reductase heme-binding subunit YedZ
MNRLILRLAALWPLAYGGYKILFNKLGAEPALELNHDAGMAAMILLVGNLYVGALFSLIKPFPTFLRFLLRERRFLGLACYFYVLIHFFFYLATEGFEPKGFIQIPTKLYLALGFCALFVLSFLAATSNDFSVRKLGGKRWKAIHRFVYLAFLLISVHMFLIEKADRIEFAIYLFPLWAVEIIRFFRYLKSRFFVNSQS